MEQYRFSLLMETEWADCWTGGLYVERTGGERRQLAQVTVRKGFALLPHGRDVREFRGDWRLEVGGSGVAARLLAGRQRVDVVWHAGRRMPHTRERALFVLVPGGMGQAECGQRFRRQMEQVQLWCGGRLVCVVEWQVAECRAQQAYFEPVSDRPSDPFEDWPEEL